MRKGLAVVMAVVSVACGGGATGGDAGEAPGRPSTTAAGEAPSTSTGETTTVRLYFTLGEKVGPVERAVPKVSRIGAEAVKALVAGPTDDERRDGYATAIPAGTRFNGLTIDSGLARVDLSRAFESGGGLGLSLRLAQVVCTLDAFPTVDGVRFALDGQLVDVLSGDGLLVDRPVRCEDYREHFADTGGGPERPPAVFAGIWPFATAAAVRAYEAGGDQAFRDPVATARAFAERYLGITGAVTFDLRPTGNGAAEVPVGFRGEDGRPATVATTVVQVRQLGTAGTSGAWTAVGATSPDIEVHLPVSGGRVASPVALSGRARAFEGTVQVEVREDGMVFGQSIGSTFVTGRGDGVLGPFTGSVSYRTPSRPGGAVVFFERSQAGAGSTVLRAAAVRVALT
ncbi:MAG: GerMN domain-containing protein [Acidimicrobiia bacterium]